jgi:cyclopropane-fatty-acyl-phospholipid synthase
VNEGAGSYEELVARGRLPVWLFRLAVRLTLQRGLRQGYARGAEKLQSGRRALLRKFRRSPMAQRVEDANRQHYEVPARFFELVLGARMKYSCCLWPPGTRTLDQAEEAMLRLTCERAGIEDGMRVLDLGCGWGSLSLWIAEHYPKCSVLALSNSRTQAAYITSACRARGLSGVEAMTADVSEARLATTFDRVVSIEMFEHMKNYAELMALIAGWLRPGGRLFVHHFSHREFLYEFHAEDPADWMARTYFAGGTMPSDDMLLYFQADLQVRDHWRVSGMEYARTLRAWGRRLDRNRKAVGAVFQEADGAAAVARRLAHWKLFFLVCEETFALRRGNEYLVSHLLFDKR